MNRILFGCIGLFLFIGALQGQKSEGGKPFSGTVSTLKSTAIIPQFTLKAMDITRLLEEDELNPLPARYGIIEEVDINIKSSGMAEEPQGISGKIWRYRVEAGMAKSIQLKFKKFIVPEGARLYLYNDAYNQIAGAYTKQNVSESSLLVLADFQGNHVNIEYFEPDNPEFEGEIILGSIGQAYKDIFKLKNGESYTNINCPEGKNLQLSKHAVCKLTFESGKSSYLCSGALVNNARQDGTPYFLTANHCISDSIEASTLVAYFNDENEGCDGMSGTPLTLSGARFLTGGSASDYTLLLLDDAPTSAYQPYFAGWNANDVASTGVSGVHHPEGLTKKLSLDFDSITANEIPVRWDGNTLSPVGSHWVVNFDIGITAGGSSGSPLFNNKHQIIGQLHGGDDIYDMYGKFSYSYEHPSGGKPAMKVFLDGDNTGIKILGGYSPPDNPPDVFFTLPAFQVCLGAPINFKDFSVFAPLDLKWSITPSTFIFTNGTSAESADPVIKFLEEGLYTVKLIATNSSGTDSMIRPNAMLAGTTIQVEVKSFPEDEICDCDFKSARLEASGADSFSWSVLPADIDKIVLSNTSGDTTTMKRISGFKASSDYTVGYRIVGKQSTCIDTLIGTFNLIKPENDEIENAILLDYGLSSVYSNICATVEEGEPIPPYMSCTAQHSWCDEYGTGEDIVENSVWFKFIASPTGLVSISSTGFDNQIALYEADSYEEILAGNYNMVGANDDRSETNFRPLLISEPVIPGNTYWIQVDGSGGGEEDNFYITINELSPTPNETYLTGNVAVYPIPADHHVTVYNPEWSGSYAGVWVYNMSGLCIFDSRISLNDKGIKISISSWESGIYVAMIEIDNARYMARIVKR